MTVLGKKVPEGFASRVADAIRELAALVQTDYTGRRKVSLQALADYVRTLDREDSRLLLLHLTGSAQWSTSPEQTKLLQWLGSMNQPTVPEPDEIFMELAVAGVEDLLKNLRGHQFDELDVEANKRVVLLQEKLAQEQAEKAKETEKYNRMRAERDHALRQARYAPQFGEEPDEKHVDRVSVPGHSGLYVRKAAGGGSYFTWKVTENGKQSWEPANSLSLEEALAKKNGEKVPA